MSSVIALSNAEEWDDARAEWEVIDCIDDMSCAENCVCGQEGLRYQFTIKNVVNGNTLFPIGSTCIEKFGVDAMTREQRAWREAINLMNEAVRLGRGKYVPFDARFYSRRLLLFLYKRKAFDSYRDYKFMLDTFNARSRTDEENERVDSIVTKSIYPWLRELYRETRLRAS